MSATPRRIVSLTCSNTEIVAALGCGDRLVGVDDHSDFPPELLEGLPRVGPDLGIDVGAVAALEPDLVLASLTVPGHEKVVAAVEEAGLPYMAPSPETIGDVYVDVRRIAERLGVPQRGEEVVREMRAALEADVEADVKAGKEEGPNVSDERPRIAVQWWPKPPILPGRRSWVHELITRAGGVNVLDEDVKSRPVEPEELAEMDPDALVIAWCGVEESKYRPDVIYDHPAYADTRFVRHRQVHTISEAFLGRPSPRLVEGLRALRTVVESARAV